MKTTKILMTLCLTAFFAFAFEAASPEYEGWMKSFASQQKNIKKKMDVAKNAADMEATAKMVGAWWAKKNDDVAAKAVASVIAGAQALQKNPEDMSAMQTIGSGCNGCHMVHRGQGGEIK